MTNIKEQELEPWEEFAARFAKLNRSITRADIASRWDTQIRTADPRYPDREPSVRPSGLGLQRAYWAYINGKMHPDETKVFEGTAVLLDINSTISLGLVPAIRTLLQDVRMLRIDIDAIKQDLSCGHILDEVELRLDTIESALQINVKEGE